jgi:2-alkyl-3-oxoalkanoate reductase
MNGRRIALVTGGTGFIGRSLVDALLAKGNLVRVIARRPVVRWRVEPNIDHIRADLSEPGVLEAALTGVDEVYHLAAATSGSPEYYQRVTVEGSERLLATLAARGGGRVVMVSSASVYDAAAMIDGAVVDEGFLLERNPQLRGLYARTKAEAELKAQAYLTHPTVKLSIVRPGLVYGPRSKNILNGAALSVRNQLLITTGTPRKPLPLIYIDDLVEMLLGIAANDAAVGQTYNLAHPSMPTTAEFIESWRRISGDRRPIAKVPLPALLPLFRLLDQLARKLGRSANYSYTATRLASSPILSVEKMSRELSCRPRIGFEEGLERACRN